MVALDIGLLESLIVFVGGLLLYVIIRAPDYRKQLKIGLLLFAYVRDISNLLLHKLLGDWKELSIPNKLDRLKAIYDLIESFDTLETHIKDVDVNEEIDSLLQRGRL
jgi:hypothetical protein